MAEVRNGWRREKATKIEGTNWRWFTVTFNQSIADVFVVAGGVEGLCCWEGCRGGKREEKRLQKGPRVLGFTQPATQPNTDITRRRQKTVWLRS